MADFTVSTCTLWPLFCSSPLGSIASLTCQLAIARPQPEWPQTFCGAAGIDVRWVDCNDRISGQKHATSEVCLTPPNSDEVIVRFVSAPNTAHTRSGARQPRRRLCRHRRGTRLSGDGLCRSRRRSMARAANLDTGTLLGRVMAHEIGHLLLGTAMHRPSGLMRAEWSTTLLARRIPNDWRFSTLDAAGAREGVLKRAHADQQPIVQFDAARPFRASTRSTKPVPATCPSCPICATLLPADRVPFHLLVEPSL